MGIMASFSGNQLSISCLRPPYTRPESFAAPGDQHPVSLALGALLVVSLGDHTLREASAERGVADLRSRFPAFPLILSVGRVTPHEAMELGVRARMLHFRAVLIETPPSRQALCDALTDPTDLGADVLEWFALRRVRLQPQLASFVGAVFQNARGVEGLTALLSGSGCPDRTVRAQCRKVGAVSPGHWFQLARATHAALSLERERAKSLLNLALDLGYHDQSGLIHQLDRLFGLRPSEIRPLLGWECLLDRWFGRCASHIATHGSGAHNGITCRVEHRIDS